MIWFVFCETDHYKGVVGKPAKEALSTATSGQKFPIKQDFVGVPQAWISQN
jgi:hypothetical protein